MTIFISFQTDSSDFVHTLLHKNDVVHQIKWNKLMQSQINTNSKTWFQNGWQLMRINKIHIFKWYLIKTNFQFQPNIFY